MPSIDKTSPETKPLLLIIGFISLLGISGCFDFSGKRAQNRQRLIDEKMYLESIVKKSAPLFIERDQIRQQLNNLEAQLEQLATAKKQMEAKK